MYIPETVTCGWIADDPFMREYQSSNAKKRRHLYSYAQVFAVILRTIDSGHFFFCDNVLILSFHTKKKYVGIITVEHIGIGANCCFFLLLVYIVFNAKNKINKYLGVQQ